MGGKKSRNFLDWTYLFGSAWIVFNAIPLCFCDIDYDDESGNDEMTRFHTCCQENEYFDVVTLSCQNEIGIFNKKLISDYDEISFLEPKMLTCSENEDLKFFYKAVENYYITGDHLQLSLESTKFSPEKYCLDDGFKKRYTNIADQNKFLDFARTLPQGASYVDEVAVVCLPKEESDCKSRPCFNDCCPVGYGYDPDAEACTRDFVGIWWEGRLYEKERKKWMDGQEMQRYLNSSTDTPVRIFYNRLESLGGCATDSYKFGESAWVYITGYGEADGEQYNYTQFCVGTVGSTNESHQVLVACQSQEFNEFNAVFGFQVIPALSLISAASLTCLFILLWRKDRSKLFASMVLCMIATLIAFYILLSIIKLGGEGLIEMKTFCQVLGFFAQYTNLSAFFWLNALSIEIWMKFRSLKSPKRANLFTKRASTMGCTKSRFKRYAFFAWGGPLIIVAVTLIMQFSPLGILERHNLVLPKIGDNTCYFESKWSFLYYLYAILAPVLALNLFFFFSFIYNLLFGIWSKSSSMVERQKNRSNLLIVSKIFFIMGITWVAEIISFFVSWKYGEFYTYKYVSIFDVINALQGTFIAILMIFDAKTVKNIKGKLGKKSVSLAETSVDNSTV